MVEWASIVNTETIGKDELEILKREKVDGKALPHLTEEKLRSVGFPLGAAIALAEAIEKLKKPTGNKYVYK